MDFEALTSGEKRVIAKYVFCHKNTIHKTFESYSLEHFKETYAPDLIWHDAYRELDDNADTLSRPDKIGHNGCKQTTKDISAYLDYQAPFSRDYNLNYFIGREDKSVLNESKIYGVCKKIDDFSSFSQYVSCGLTFELCYGNLDDEMVSLLASINQTSEDDVIEHHQDYMQSFLEENTDAANVNIIINGPDKLPKVAEQYLFDQMAEYQKEKKPHKQKSDEKLRSHAGAMAGFIAQFGQETRYFKNRGGKQD